jgi:hypothetical protein
MLSHLVTRSHDLGVVQAPSNIQLVLELPRLAVHLAACTNEAVPLKPANAFIDKIDNVLVANVELPGHSWATTDTLDSKGASSVRDECALFCEYRGL